MARNKNGTFKSNVQERLWFNAKFLLSRGHRVIDVCKVYPEFTPGMLYTRNYKEWKIKLRKSASRGVRCPGCNEIKPNYRGGLCLNCFNISKRKGRPSGEKHHQWKGGISKENQRIRTSPEYKHWRLSVFVRDNFTCQKCGVIGGRLRAHHIKPFSTNKRLRLDVKNGKTLCIYCHKKEHNGRG